MPKLNYLTLCLLAALATAGCGDDAVEITAVKPVIEAWIDSDGYPVALFTTSVTPGVDGSIADNVINWGKVTISDGVREIVMTGSPDKTYTPPYRYYTFDITGEPGREYTITASYKGLQARATAYMPEPTPIDSVTFQRAESDSLRSATLHFTAPRDVPAYYYLTIQDASRPSQPMPCMLGTIRAATPGEHLSIPIFHSRQRIEGSVFVPQLSIGENLEVRLNRVSREVYDFWTAYDNMVNFGSSPFISVDQSLPGNVTGGYGIFSARGSSVIMFKVLDTKEPYTIYPRR